MKSPFQSIACILAFAAISAAPLHAQAAPTKDIVDTAVANGSFKTLAAALQAADLVDTLKGKGPFTVFAPSDDAFAKLPAGTVENLLKPENKAQLTAILTNHVVAGGIPLATAVEAAEATTLQGSKVKIRFENGFMKAGDANLIKADIMTSNGVIHVVDNVLMPTPVVGDTPEKLDIDLASAKTIAFGESKDILLVFNDSVASNPGNLLEEMILSKKELNDAASEHFVIVRIENPRNTSLLSDKEREENAALWKKYGVSIDDNAPTIFLCDKEGRPYAATGYRMGGVTDYLEHLDELRAKRDERDSALKTAAAAELVKAKVMSTAKQAMNLKPEVFATFYGEAMGEMEKADTEN